MVEIPGQSRRDLVDTVKRQAQLRFRLVACSDRSPAAAPAPADAPQIPTDAEPGEHRRRRHRTGRRPTPPSDAPSDGASRPTRHAVRQRQPGPGRLRRRDRQPEPRPSAADSTSAEPSDGATAPSDAGAPPASPPRARRAAEDVGDPLTWIDSPNQEAIDAYNAFTCPPDGTPVNVEDDPEKPLVTCGTGRRGRGQVPAVRRDDRGHRARRRRGRDPAERRSTTSSPSTSTATAPRPSPTSPGPWSAPRSSSRSSSTARSSPRRPWTALITDGQAQISGNFTQDQRREPGHQPQVRRAADRRSTTTPASRPSAPRWPVTSSRRACSPARIGLLLVMLYCLLYYRGLGLVVVASLLVAAAATYAMVLLLRKTANFTLTLPGIAGLIVAVGITADSFIVYFERIRDEMRDGKSMRVAVEAGWMRARNTCLAADAVSLLAAVVLYIFAAGVVQGLRVRARPVHADRPGGLLLVHQADGLVAGAVQVLQQRRKLSGLSAETLGIDDRADRPRSRSPRAPARGRQGLMGRFAQLGNEPLQRPKLDRLRRPQVALVRHLGRHRAARHPRRSPSRASTTASSSPAASQYKVSPAQRQVDPGQRGRAARGGRRPRHRRTPRRPIVTTVRRRTRSWSRPRSSPARRATEVRGRSSSTVGVDPDDISQDQIGASWGEEVADRALLGLVVFLVLVMLFIWAYFREWKMSVAAMVALAHDVMITVGIYALSGFEVTPATVTGLLDDPRLLALRHRRGLRQGPGEHQEPAATSQTTYAEAANLAVNQTLVRSINTSIVALIPVGAILYVERGPARRQLAEGPRARAVRRHGGRRLLLDLHRARRCWCT